MKIKAFGYIRVSGLSQVKGDGFERQEEAIQAYAKANNLEVVQVFREEGVSGTMEQRPALAQLLVSLEKNGHGIKTVIIEKLDRLARDLMVQEAIIRDFQKHDFQLISALEGPELCMDDPSRKLVRQIFGVIAEYEKSMLVLKLRAARERQKAKTGKCEGRKGYHEEDPDIVRYIQRLRRKPKHRKRLTYQQIADRLNAEGMTTLDGMQWTLHRVNQVLYPYKKK